MILWLCLHGDMCVSLVDNPPGGAFSVNRVNVNDVAVNYHIHGVPSQDNILF